MSAAEHYRLAAEGWEAAQAVSDPSVRALLMAEAMRSAAAGTEEIAAEREALVLSLMPGRTCAEVGAMLDMSASNVSTITRRARAKEWGPTPPKREPAAPPVVNGEQMSAAKYAAGLRESDWTAVEHDYLTAAETATRGALTLRGAPDIHPMRLISDGRLFQRWASEELRDFARTNPLPRRNARAARAARRVA